MIRITSLSRIEGMLTTPRDGGDASFAISAGKGNLVTNGIAAGQANAIFLDDFVIAASGTMLFDLAGALVDAHGNALVFTAIKEILVVAADANTNSIVVGNGGVNSFLGPFGAAAHTVAVQPGGRFGVSNYSAAGWPVVAGTGDILQLANSGAGTSVAGTIVLIGMV